MADTGQTPLAIREVYVVGLGDIVVLGGQPEQRDDRAAHLLLEAGGEADSRERLV